MQILKNTPLAPYTSLGCGGPAETLVITESYNELKEYLTDHDSEQLTILGYGTNSLISDAGLAGTTIITHGGTVSVENGTVLADAGVWWDDVVTCSIEHVLWGLELTSGIPSSVGGAVMGNIAAYGQQVSDHLAWVEVFNKVTHAVERIDATAITFSYRASSLQSQPNLIILRAAFKLSGVVTVPLAYASALTVADELGLNTQLLADRRTIVMEARHRAGSIYNLGDDAVQKTAGSFFKNPLLTSEQAEVIAKSDETKKSLALLLEQNKIHGGEARRASAAHVLLAAGFKRGQSWGAVRLHPDHILKIENTGDASAQDIYNVAQLIITQVKDVLGITLEPEVQFIGSFDGVE